MRVTPGMRRAFWAVLLGAAVATCRDAPTGPGRGGRASLAVVPVLPALVDNLAAFGLSIDSLRVVVVHAPADTVADTTVSFAADQDSIQLALSLPLEQSPDTFTVALELRGGGFVLFSGSAPAEVHAGSNAPVEITNFLFTGPGAGVTTLLVTPVDSVIRFGDSLRFRVDALAGTVPVTQFYVSWSTNNTLAPINAHGVLRAPAQRALVLVTATTPTGITTTVPVTFVPVPTAMAAVAPIPQNVPALAPIGPLRVRVLAADGLGIKGVPVTFAAVSGGGSISDLVVATDSAGFAQTDALSGPAGISVYSATAAGLSVTFNVTVVGQVATQLGIAIPPAVAIAGQPFALGVEVRDAQGIIVTTATDPVTIALGANPGGATLGGTLTVNAVAGLALFADLTIDEAASGYTLVATAPALTAATTPPFDVILGFSGRLWTNPLGGAWSNPTNWSDSIVPVAGDSVYILLDGDYTVTLDVNASLGALYIGGSSGVQTVSGANRTLQVDGVLQIAPTAVLDLVNSAIAGDSGQVFNAGALRLQTSTVAGGVFNFTGGSVVVRGATAVNGAFTNSIDALTRIETDPFCCSATLTVNGALTNMGMVELTSINGSSAAATLSAPNDIAANLPGGTIAALAGTGGGRTLSVELENQGTVLVEQDVLLTATSAAHQNDGTILLNGGNLTVAQSGIAAAFSTSGSIVVSAGRTLTVSGGAFDYDNAVPGGLAGHGTVSFQNTTLGLTPALSNDSLTLSFVNSTVNGPGTLTNSLGRTLTVQQTAINAPFVNLGTFVVRGSSSIGGTLTAPATSTIRVQTDPFCCSGTLTVASGFTNGGLIELTSINGASAAATLAVTSGTLVNATGATIASLPGTGGPRFLQAQLSNDGTLLVGQDLQLTKSDVDYLNSGVIQLTTGNLTLSQSGSTPTFASPGSIVVGTGRTLTVSGGTFQYSSAAPGGIGGVGAINFSGATLGLAQGLTNDSLALSFVNSTVSGPAALTNAAGATLTIQQTAINAPFVNGGTLVSRGGSSLVGGVTTQTGSTIQLQTDPFCCSSTLTVPGGFTNNGLLELTSINGASATATLDVPSGFLVNATGGTVAVRAGTGGPRTLAAALNNQGVLIVEQDVLLNAGSADHVNSGTINLTGGSLTVSQSGTTPTFGTTGTVIVGVGRTLQVNGGAFNYANGAPGGLVGLGTAAFNGAVFNLTPALGNDSLSLSFVNSTVSGPGMLTNAAGRTLTIQTTALNAPFVNQGLLVARGTSSLGGSVTAAAGGTIRVETDPFCCAASLSVANPLTNDGLIELTSINGASATASMDVAGGLTNNPGGTIALLPGSGGARVLNAQLFNHGTLNVTAPATLSAASGDQLNNGAITVSGATLNIPLSAASPTFTNQGQFQLAGGATAAVTGGPTGSFVNATTGTLGGSGTFDIAATTFVNGGTVAPGGSPGVLTFNGTFSMTASAVLSVEIGGLTAGTQYDQVVVNGTATLAGTLNVSLLGGFVPVVTNSFTVVTATAAGGGFSLQNFPVVAGAAWVVNATGSAVTLSLISGTQAAVKTWTNLAGGVWSNAANWSPVGVPTASDSVVITTVSPYTVTVDVPANAFFLNLGGPIGGGSQTLALAGPTLTLATGALIHEAGVFNLSGGTLTGGGDVVVQSTMTWSGGAVSGVGLLTVSPGATLNLTTGPHNLTTRSLLNQGTVVWTGGNIHGSSTTIQNAGLFDIQLNGLITWTGGTLPVFENLPAGLVRRSAGAGAAGFDIALINAGTFEAQTGRLELSRGSTSSADFTVQPGATLEFAGGTHTLQSGVDFVGAGVVELTNAVLDIAATDTVQVSRLHQQGGTISGTGVLRPDSLAWTGGTQTGTGVTLIGPGATLLVNGSSVNWTRPLVNQGTLRWMGGNIAGGSVTLLNTGLLDMQVPTGTLYWAQGAAPPVLDNQGTVLRRVGTGTLTVDVTLNNAGTFDVQTGRVEFTRGGATTTDLTVQPGTTLEFAAGTYVLGTGVDFAGTGLIELTSAVLDVAATDTVQVSRLRQLGGVVQGTGVLRPDSLVWTAGTQSGAGATHIAPGATLVVGGGVNWQRPLVNQGTILWTAGNIAGSSVTLVNTGLFDMQPTTATLLWGSGATPPVLDNQGTVLRRVGTGTLTVDVTLNHTGAFDVQTGRVELTRGGSLTTDLTVQSGTTLEFAAGTYALNTGMDVVGAGLVELTSAVVNIAATDTVQVSRLHQLGGTLQGTGVLRPDSLVWNAGTQLGSGATLIGPGATLLVGGAVSWQRPLVNQGTFRWTAGNISGSPVTLLNTGLFDMQAPTATLLWGSGGTPPVLDNQGTVLRRVGTGTLTVDVTLLNNGAFDVQTGRVDLTRGGTITTDLTVQPGTTLEFAGSNYTFNTGADVVGTGVTELSAATLDIAAADTVQVNRLHQLGGTIQGIGVLRADSLVWSAGQQAGTGATHIASGATMLVTGSVTLNRALTNQGTLLWTAGNIGGGAVTLRNTGLFDVRANATITITGGTPLLLDNAGGTVLRRVGTGVAAINAVVNNSGTVETQSGILSLDRGGSGTGQYLASVGTATLRFGGSGAHTLGAGAKINGAGLVNFTGVDVTMSGTGSSYDVVGTTQIVAGIVALNTPDTARFTTFNQLGGTLRGSAPMLLRGIGTWTGGTLEGPTGSALRISNVASFAITGAATKGLTGRTILAAGPVSWAGGSVNAANGSVLDMQPGTTFDVSSTGQWSGPSTIEIRNLATMKVSTTGAVTIGPQPTVLNIDGTLDIQAGATLKNSGDFNLLGRGILMGRGVLDVGTSPKVTNAGTVQPGGSGATGILTIVAPPGAAGWRQDGATTLDIEVFGPEQGTGHDKLVVIGTITTGGSLRMIGNGVYRPQVIVLQIMTFGSRAGQTFDPLSLLGGLTGLLQINYTGNDLRLVF